MRSSFLRCAEGSHRLQHIRTRSIEGCYSNSSCCPPLVEGLCQPGLSKIGIRYQPFDDTLTFRGDIAHGPERLEKVPIRMLSIIIYGNEDD